ncbi:hypothetical protein [Xanthomonas sp. 1678]|uniref:hypothetical protein n=1 Tax=Xanthomonas sp. 1678 TaxID=3158788 RepID=UPI002859C9B9|nr:hypothetical protein [Xanthomonas translucens]
MTTKFFRGFLLTLVLMTGCTSVSAGGEDALPEKRSLCEQSRGWGGSASSAASQIEPQVSEDDSGRTYRFDLGGRGGVRSLDASCGWGSYAECDIKVLQVDGASYHFPEMSTFGLWESQDNLYLLYRIVAPKDDVAAGKRRVVRVGNPPLEVCNEIGDYSNIM